MKRSQRTTFLLAILLGAFALAGGTGLTVSSAWLITVASEQPPIMVLGVSIVLVRFFGIFRSVARYLERVLSHEAIFRKLTSLRVKLFRSIALRLSSDSISGSVKAIVDDVERAQEFFLRITLPQYAAAISGLTTLILAFWINLATFIIILLATFILAFLVPWISRKFLDPISIEIEDSENKLAQSISSAAHAIVEAEVFGYSKQYRSQLIDASSELKSHELRFHRRVWGAQLLLTSTLGLSLIHI
jgi:ABC-type transport system involved in cytochrome bd biosynthesis fused ATPase/permease subunit